MSTFPFTLVRRACVLSFRYLSRSRDRHGSGTGRLSVLARFSISEKEIERSARKKNVLHRLSRSNIRCNALAFELGAIIPFNISFCGITTVIRDVTSALFKLRFLHPTISFPPPKI